MRMTLDSPLRSAIRKCVGRKPGEQVTLTDDEVRALLDDQYFGGAEEALAQVTTVAFRRLRDDSRDRAIRAVVATQWVTACAFLQPLDDEDYQPHSPEQQWVYATGGRYGFQLSVIQILTAEQVVDEIGVERWPV